MPITVACPECAARVTAPDSAAGQRVKCPKCQALMVLPEAEPEFEVVDELVPRKRAPVRPRDEDEEDAPRRRQRDRDDAEEDEDDRPRKKKAKTKAGSSRGFLSNPIVMVVGGLLGCLVAAGFVYQVWQRSQKEAEKENRVSTNQLWGRELIRLSPPAGWQRLSVPDQGFTVHTPIALSVLDANLQDTEATGKIWQCVHNGLVYRFAVVTPKRADAKLQPNTEDFRRFMVQTARDGDLGTEQSTENITVYGCPGRQSSFRGASNSVIRVLLGKSRIYVFAVAGDAATSTTIPAVAGFLDSVEITG